MAEQELIQAARGVVGEGGMATVYLAEDLKHTAREA